MGTWGLGLGDAELGGHRAEGCRAPCLGTRGLGTHGSKSLGSIHAWGHRARPLGTRRLVLGDAGLGVWGCGAVPACPGLMQLRCPARVQNSPSGITGGSPAPGQRLPPAPSARPQPLRHPEPTAAPDLPLHAHGCPSPILGCPHRQGRPSPAAHRGPAALACPGTVLLMCHIFCISFLIPLSVETFLGNELFPLPGPGCCIPSRPAQHHGGLLGGGGTGAGAWPLGALGVSHGVSTSPPPHISDGIISGFSPCSAGPAPAPAPLCAPPVLLT